MAVGRAVVAADHKLASKAGVAILEQGGNAVDAAVATSFALSVVRPYSCGIGGGGFMVIHLVDDPTTAAPDDSLNIAFDYRERAPAAVGPDHFLQLPDVASRHSGHAVAIPGTVAGLLYALDNYGTMDRQTVLAPAIALARRGWKVDADTAAALTDLADYYQQDDLKEDLPPAHRAFVKALLVQWRQTGRIALPDQARALELIAAYGGDGFYRGPVAAAVVQAVTARDGVMTMADLASYRGKTVAPLRRTFPRLNEITVLTMPLPSSGGIGIIQMLTMLEWLEVDLDRIIHHHPHLLVEVMKFAFADRAKYLADPEFAEVPIEMLLDEERLHRRAARIDPHRTFPPAFYAEPSAAPRDAGTSHFCVIDAAGNAVSCTETINLHFGSKIPVPGFGFFLNNEMDDFATHPGRPNAFGLVQSPSNAPEPGKRPLSSMSPSIVLDSHGKVLVIAGASGGPRIITGTLQAMLIALSGGDAAAAVSSARVHHQWLPNEVFISRGTPPPPDFQVIVNQLKNRGHTVSPIDSVGVVQLISRRADGRYAGAADPSKGGQAMAVGEQ